MSVVMVGYWVCRLLVGRFPTTCTIEIKYEFEDRLLDDHLFLVCLYENGFRVLQNGALIQPQSLRDLRGCLLGMLCPGNVVLTGKTLQACVPP